MLIRLQRKELSILVLGLLAMLVYMINASVFTIAEVKIRYVFCSLALFQGVGLLTLKWIGSRKLKQNEQIKMQGRDLLFIIVVSVVFFIVSIYRAFISGHAFTDKTLKELFYIVFPALYAYALLNLLTFSTIQKFLQIMLFFVFIFAFFETGFEKLLDMDNWIGMFQLFDSSSTKFENNSYCGLVLALFCFFTYFRYSGETEWERKQSNYCFWISLFLVLFVHKRIENAFIIVVLVIDKIVDFRGKVSKKIAVFLSLFFVLATLLYFKILEGDIFSNFNIAGFSMGRAWFLSMWRYKDYLSYGFGSSVEIIGRNLEMDLVKIYLELGIIPLFLFIFGYMRIAKNNVFAYMIMIYQMFNMLFSSSLWLWYDWVVVLLTVELIHLHEREVDKMYRPKSRFRKLFKKRERAGT